MSEWQPIESAPVMTPILVCEVGRATAMAVGHLWEVSSGGNRYFQVSGIEAYDVVDVIEPTHWKPLPQPPIPLAPTSAEE